MSPQLFLLARRRVLEPLPVRDTGEPRRGARIAASFWIGIEGVDARPTLRQGNVSASGMYFETPSKVGPSGSVQFLHIESEDRRVIVQVLARIIRVSLIDDVVHGSSVGLAIEFMPSSAEGRNNLQRLVRHVVEHGLRREENIDHAFQVQLSGAHQSERTTLQHLNVQRLVLETDWRASVGDQLQFQIRGTGEGHSSVPLVGQVTAVDPVDKGYRVEVRVTGTQLAPPSADPDRVQAFTDLVSEAADDFALPAPEHLSGLLSRIKPPALMGLMEMERLSGELRFSNEREQEVYLYVRDGRPVDATGDSSVGRSPRELIAALLGWTDGHFHFALDAIDREDTLATTMTSLLLDLAREHDEARNGIDNPADDGDFF